MKRFTNYFDFPECGKLLNIHDSYEGSYWSNARLVKLGNKRNPEVVIKGQHHGNMLYLYFEIQDSTLKQAEDSLTICIDSSKKIQPGPKNILLGYELTFNETAGRLTYKECDNNNKIWIEKSFKPPYFDCEIKKDPHHSYWSAMVQINFEDLKSLDINPDSFGLYIKVLDFNSANKPVDYYYPVTAHRDDKNPDYIPPHEQWAIGRFLKKQAVDK